MVERLESFINGGFYVELTLNYLVPKRSHMQFDLAASATRYPLRMKGYVLKAIESNPDCQFTYGTDTTDNISTFVNYPGMDSKKIDSLLILASERYELFFSEIQKSSNGLSPDEKAALFFSLVLKRISLFSALNFRDELLRLQNYLNEVSQRGYSPQLNGLTLNYEFPIQIGGGVRRR